MRKEKDREIGGRIRPLREGFLKREEADMQRPVVDRKNEPRFRRMRYGSKTFGRNRKGGRGCSLCAKE